MSDDFLNDLLDLGGEELFDVQRTTIIKAPFGLPGGKSRSVKHIIPKLPVRRTWVDVFGGSGVVSWNYPTVSLNVFNDAFSGITDFYKCLQSDELCQQLLESLELMPALGREMFYHCRDTWCTEQDTVLRAAKWFYMIRSSFTGKGLQFGRATSGKAPIKIPLALEDFRKINSILKAFQIENLDWRICLKDYDSKDTVFYLDPPYVNTDQLTYSRKFTEEHLREMLSVIPTMKGCVALSHYSSTLIESQSYWDQRHSWKVAATSETQEKGSKTPPIVEERLWIKL